MARYRDETDRRRRPQQPYYGDTPPEWNMRSYGPPPHSTSYDTGRALHRPEERNTRRPKGRRASNEARSEFTMAPPLMAAVPRAPGIMHQGSLIERPTYYEQEGVDRTNIPRRHSMRDEYHEGRSSRRTVEPARYPPGVLPEGSTESSSDDDEEEEDDEDDDDDDDDDDEDDDDDDEDESSEDSNIPERESEADDEASLTRRQKRVAQPLSDSSDLSEGDDDYDDYVDVKRRAKPGPRRPRHNFSPTSDEDSPSPLSPKELTAPPRRSMTVMDDHPTPRAIEAASPPPRAMTGPSPRTSSTRVTGVMVDPRLQMSPKRLSKQRDVTFPDARQDSGHRRSRKSTSSRGSLRSSSNLQSSVLDSMRSSISLPMTPEKRIVREHRREKHRDGKHHRHVECVACKKDKPSSGVTNLNCGHRMCNSCLLRKFNLAASDNLHMPPQCCNDDQIHLKYIEPLCDDDFKRLWNRRYSEYTIVNRLYCPSKRCMEWIKPAHVGIEGNRECAKCNYCDTKVCVACNGKWHASPECPSSEETKRALRQAMENPRLRCFWCNSKVERIPGANHATCECGVQLCMLCGSKRGREYCSCQLFELELDSGLDLYLAGSTDDVFEMNGPVVVRNRRRKSENERPKRRARRRTHEDGTYHRGFIEDDLARRFTHDLTLHEEPSDMDDDLPDDVPGSIGLGISTTSGPNRGHQKRGAGKHRTMASSAPAAPPPAPEPPKRRSVERLERMERVESFTPSPQSKSFDRESYVTDMHRARGPRVGSMERRLADRFGGDPRQGMPTRPEAPPGPSGPPGPPPMSPSMMMPGAPAPPPPPMGPTPGGPFNNMGMPMRMPPPGNAPIMMPPMPPPPFGNASYGHSYGPPPNSSRDHIPVMEAEQRRRHEEESVPRSSQMAGLDGSGGGMDRVKEWRHFVKPGRPEEDGSVVG